MWVAFYGSLSAVTNNEIMAVVQLHIVDPKTNISNEGSATFISGDGYLLTNYHVISPAIQDKTRAIILCLTSDARKPPLCSPVGLELRAYNENADLALLKLKLVLPSGSTTPVDFATFIKDKHIVLNHVDVNRAAQDEQISLGDQIQILGYPLAGGLSITYTEGVVSGFERIPLNGSWLPWLIKTDATVNPGNSGGAAFDQSNHFIGIPTLVRTDAGEIGYIISLPVVNSFLDAVLTASSTSGTR
ncbi:MAG TPA: serine protease [Verrucomicrobiae bacterium]|nr:serine protease [Verrucomicrobiae bacterium]